MGNSSSRTPVPANWDASQMPSQKGKLAVVTGANSGIGYEAALQLARKGAHVVLACRNETRGKEAESSLRETLVSEPEVGSVEFMQLDVSDLSSVKAFAENFKKSHKRLDLLINNAGIMGGPYATTVDGYELQFATNHLGHFALTAELFYVVKQSAPSRIVNVSSLVHRHAMFFNEDAIMATSAKGFLQWFNYASTKLCNLLFTVELNRRLHASGVHDVRVVACHPGIAASNLLATPSTANSSLFWRMVFKLTAWLPSQSVPMGALPTLFAATGSDVQGGDFYGPKHLFALFGYPARETPSRQARSETASSKLWALSERLAHLTFVIEKPKEA